MIYPLYNLHGVYISFVDRVQEEIWDTYIFTYRLCFNDGRTLRSPSYVRMEDISFTYCIKIYYYSKTRTLITSSLKLISPGPSFVSRCGPTRDGLRSRQRYQGLCLLQGSWHDVSSGFPSPFPEKLLYCKLTSGPINFSIVGILGDSIFTSPFSLVFRVPSILKPLKHLSFFWNHRPHRFALLTQSTLTYRSSSVWYTPERSIPFVKTKMRFTRLFEGPQDESFH